MEPRYFLTGLVVLIVLSIVVALVYTAGQALARRLKRRREDN
jgi:hypothetical protein